jgi:membrane-bound metal-dependent hydrolase YbcI (DUF457 family)
MALAYLLGKPSAKLLKVNLNIPLLLVLSIIPDIDILLMPQMHRGPTHSIITAILVFIPFFVAYRQKTIPYFIALISHSLIGDFLVGGRVMLFWPLTKAEFGLHELGSYYITIENPVNVALELILFLAATAIMLKTKDILQFFQNKKSNLILIIPILTVLLPSAASYPLDVPAVLAFPHLFYLVLFIASVLMVIARSFRKRNSG